MKNCFKKKHLRDLFNLWGKMIGRASPQIEEAHRWKIA